MSLFVEEFAFPDDELANVMGLSHRSDGWGCLFCVADDGAHITVAGSGAFLRTLLGLPPGHDTTTPLPPIPRSELGVDELPPESFPYRRCGWPDEWTQDDLHSPWADVQ